VVTVAIRSTIRYAEDEFRVTNLLDWLTVLDSRLAAQGIPPAPRPLGEDPAAPPVYARMNHARWLGECECGSAVMLFRQGPWFWCPTCANAGTGGKMRPISWPEPAELERVNRDMATLPAGLANWDPEVKI
jgi:hypothetical protein